MDRFRAAWIRGLISIAAALFAIGAAEAAARIIDGFALTSIELQPIRRQITSASNGGKWLDAREASAYASHALLAPGVDPNWFALDPDRPPPRAVDPDIGKRYRAAAGHELPAVYEWNIEFLSSVLCRGDRSTHPYLANQLGSLKDVYVFVPASRTPFPTYRFLRSVQYPSGLRTNAFGWRGPDIPLDKPRGRIRIGFVGASTTVDAHADAFSYPEYIGRWLTEWAKARSLPISFDIANAGREGILSESIAAVVRDELLPVRPDLVVYYEGVNQFWPNSFSSRSAIGVLRLMSPGSTADRYSALAKRLHEWIDQPATGDEPPKPPVPVRWPADLDEFHPRLDDPRLPVQLPRILHDLDQIRGDLQGINASLMLSSFVALVDSGLVLRPERDGIIYRELNERYWPFSYAHMRRFFDFENRVFRQYAIVHELPFNDLDARFPHDPRLFVDMVHMTPAGVKLKAWIVFQSVAAEIGRRISSGRLPLDDPGGRVVHPAFAEGSARLERMDALKEHCGKQ